jgi:hypothetical protein
MTTTLLQGKKPLFDSSTAELVVARWRDIGV